MKRLNYFFIVLMLIGIYGSYEFHGETGNNVQIISEPDYEEIYEAGSYPVVLEFEDEYGNKTTKTLYVTIKYPRTVENEKYQEFIDAHDIVLKKGELTNLSDLQILYLLKARAWSGLDNTNIPVKIIKLQKMTTSNDYYEVTLATEKGTTTKVHIFEVENMYTSSLPQYFDYFSDTSVTYNVFVATSEIIIIIPFIIFTFSFKRVENELKSLEKLLFRKKRN